MIRVSLTLRNLLSKQEKIFKNYKYFGRLITQKQLISKTPVPVKKVFNIEMHPKNLDAEVPSETFPKGPKIISLTKPFEIPSDMYNLDMNVPKSPKYSKFEQIAILGPPNSGKSSQVNKLQKEEISAVSSKSYTTDEVIETYRTNEESGVQLRLFDTPGLITEETKQRDQKYEHSNEAYKAADKAQKILYVLSCTQKVNKGIIKQQKILKDQKNANLHKFKMDEHLDDMAKNSQNQNIKSKDMEMPDHISNIKLDHFNSLAKELDNLEEPTPIILVINKIDLMSSKRKIMDQKYELEAILNFEKTFIISCKTDYGISELTNYLEEKASKENWRVNPNKKIKNNEVQILHEIIKSAIYSRYYYEIPFHVIYKIIEYLYQIW